jgi:RNA polymerase sigma-70 factor (ECF subfamily)
MSNAERNAAVPTRVGTDKTAASPDATDANPLVPIDHETRDRLFRLAYRFLWNRHDADDVVQSALATAWEKAGQLRDYGKSWSWLCGIVVQRCRLLRRRAGRWAFHWNHYAPTVREEADSRTHPDSADVLRALLTKLPRRQHEVLVLRDLQGMSYHEIATVLGITASTARVHAQAARESLRKLVLETQPELLDDLQAEAKP